jgi:hypothetical protein
MRRRALALALLVLATLPGLARADDPPQAAETAAELRRRGDEAMDQRRAAEALEAYRRAAALEPAPALLYNIGRALLATGDFAGALASFEQYQREAPEELKARTHLLGQIMTELEGKVATVEIAGTPAGARVLVRNVDVGAVPLALRVNAGAAEIRVVHEGYEPTLETRMLAPRTATRIDVALAPERTTGQLAIVARPGGTTVRVDGRPRGASPLTLDLEPGSHEVVLDAPAHQRRTLAIAIARGESRRIDVTLDRRATPLLESPWFWTGVGAVVVGAVATTLALTLDRSPNEGSLGTYHVR